MHSMAPAGAKPPKNDGEKKPCESCSDCCEQQNDVEQIMCGTSGCGKPASKLRCPTCLKMGLPDAYFCSQQCFRDAWSDHKQCHGAVGKQDTGAQFNPWPNYRFTGELRPAPQSARRPVPEHIPRPDYALHPEGVSLGEKNARSSGQIIVLTEDEQEGVRLASRLGREVLDEAARAIAPGVTTDEIDRVVHEACIERDCYPSPLGYYRFPKSCCTSVNEVVCHGIPDQRPLVNGDICNGGNILIPPPPQSTTEDETGKGEGNKTKRQIRINNIIMPIIIMLFWTSLAHPHPLRKGVLAVKSSSPQSARTFDLFPKGSGWRQTNGTLPRGELEARNPIDSSAVSQRPATDSKQLPDRVAQWLSSPLSFEAQGLPKEEPSRRSCFPFLDFFQFFIRTATQFCISASKSVDFSLLNRLFFFHCLFFHAFR